MTNQERNLGNFSVDEFQDRYIVLGSIGQGDYGEVFKVTDTILNRVLAMKITSSNNSMLINNADEEASTLELLEEKFGKYTPCIVNVVNYGSVSNDIIEILNLDTKMDDDYGEEIITVFLTMPLLRFDSEILYSPDMEFELIMTLTLLNQARWKHNDIHPGNIGYIEVDYTRVYNINGIEYIVTDSRLPIIIDWTEYMGTRLPSEPIGDLHRLSRYVFQEPTLYPALSHNDGLKAIMSNHFISLRERHISFNTTVKYFEPIKIS